jgi:antitoxin component YwqK of YwqJK toxin-antitoxin module/CHAT domain-containing protein/tetratricopeptide (TPR) repeat protein
MIDNPSLMLKQYYLLLFCFIISLSAFAQYPEAPNEKDTQGLRTGRWTLLFDKDFKPTEIKDSVKFFRVITYQKGIPSGRVYDYYISGALQTEMNLLSDQPTDVFDGKVVVYYERGNLAYRYYFVKGTVDGKYEEYYTNGVLKAVGQYKNGKQDGYWKYFHESGEKSVEYGFKDGLMSGSKIMYSVKGKMIEKTQYLENKKTGVYESWYENGVKEQEGNFLDDKRTGYWKFWYENGAKQSEGNFIEEKKEGKFIFYHENTAGAIASTGSYVNGKQEGEWIYYHENGQKKSVGKNVNHLSEGVWTSYYASGKLEETRMFVHDSLNGPCKTYYESGRLASEGNYAKDKRNGFWKFYHENGKLQRSLNYTYGLADGYREMYSENGTIIDKISFEKDTMTGPFFQYYDDGTIKQKGTVVKELKEDWVEEYYPNGKLKQKAKMHLNLYDGFSETYFENGALYSKGNYVKGLREGTWEYYYENGRLQLKANFVKDKKEGFSEWYFENGQLDGKGNLKNNYLHGYWDEYYANGKLKSKGIYADSANKEGPWVFYFDNGNIEKEGNYKNGTKSGEWKYYHSNGTINSKGKMDNGTHGTWVFYDSLGNKTNVTEFEHGYKNGKNISYVNNKVDTVYLYNKDELLTISTIMDSIDRKIAKHQFKEAEALVDELKKMEAAQYPENSIYRHLYLRKYENLYYAKKEYKKSEGFALKYLETLARYKLDTTGYYEVELNNLANSYTYQQRYNEAIKYYRRSLAPAIKRNGLNDPGTLITVNNISEAYGFYGKQDSALYTLTNYRDQLKEKYGEVDSSYYLTLDYIARFYSDQGEYKKSIETYFYLANLLEKQNKITKPDYRQTISSIAKVYEQLHEYDKAIPLIKKADKLYKSNNDTLSNYYFFNMKILADYYAGIGRADGSFIVNTLVIEKMKNDPFVDYRVYKNTLYEIAGYYYDNELYDEALIKFFYIKELLEKDGAQYELMYGHVLQTLAYIYNKYYTGRTKEAVLFFESSVKYKSEAFGAQSTHYLTAVSDLSRFYALVQDFEKATATGKALLPEIEKVLGKEHLVYAHHLEAMGDIYYNYTDYDQAMPYYLKAYEFYAANKNNEFNHYVKITYDLAQCNERLYKEPESEKIYLGIIQEVDKKIGKENVNYIMLTVGLVDLYMFLDRDNSAKIYLKEILPITKKVTGEEGDYYFGNLNRLARIELKLREYVKCDSLLAVMRDISMKHQNISSANYLIYLKEKANLEYVKGNHKEADVYYIQSLKLTDKLYGNNSENYASLLKKIAIFYRNISRYSESEEYLLKAKATIEAIYGKKLLEYAYYVEELAKTTEMKGAYAQSEKYFEESIAIYEKENTKKSWNYLNAGKSKAKMYVSAGLYNKAKETYEENLKSVEDYVGKESAYALVLSEIANLYRHSASYNKAIEYQKESQKILSSIYSVQSSNYINGLSTLGVIYLDANQLDSAAYYFDEYKRLVRKLYPSDSVAIAIYYHNYAVLSLKKGKYEESEKFMAARYKIDKDYIAKEPTNYINFYHNYARLYTAWNKYDKAEKYWGDVLPAILSYTNKMFGEFTEQEKTQFWSEYSRDFEIYNSYCLLHSKTKPEILQKMYDNRIATKAIVLNSINKVRKRIYSSHDTTLIKKYEDWQVLKDRTARYYGVSPKQLKEAGISLDSMDRLLERLEKDLNISVEDKKQEKLTMTSWKEIQKKMLPGEASVEIIRFRNYTNYLTDSVVYAALIVTANTKENPDLVILPYGNELESRYLTFYRNAIKFRTPDSLSYDVFWQPLEKKLKGINTLYLSLDGVYNQLNINTLMLPDGSYLLDKRKIIIVSNTKDVLVLKSGSQISKNNSSQGVHLFGFPDYDAGMDNLPAKSGTERDVNINMDFASHNTITKLPGTKAEMEKIVVLLADKQWRFRSYQSEQATEDLVKRVQNPLVLHIATHGFFLGEEQVKLGAENGYMNGQKYNPLLMSGLIMAGATKSLLGYSSQESENGILTALEASTLNLDGTELVILSACETGKGEIKVGEGVYGLQRAFQVAGSKATIMSLWKVDDIATQQLMENFYRYWMESGNKTEAFRKAQLEVRQKYPSPYYWGAFVMMGQ